MRISTGFYILILSVFLMLLNPGNTHANDHSNDYKVFIVTDTIDQWSQGIIDGFTGTLNDLLSIQDKNARYTIFDTEVNPDNIPSILNSIIENEPDLICMVNFPSGFADSMITSRLTDPRFKFVSENAVALEMGLIDSLENPGGNVTGVGVFLQQNPQIRIMQLINPEATKLVFYSWDQMVHINEWFEKELNRVAIEEDIELVEFRRVRSAEEQFEFIKQYDNRGDEYFIMAGISAFVDEEGNFVDMNSLESAFFRNEVNTLPYIVYDEQIIEKGALGGASVIWSDIGAQLAEKGFRILNGENPGDIPWDYPRKYNIILNLATAERLGLEIPQELLGAAYRIYTDYEGTYVGR